MSQRGNVVFYDTVKTINDHQTYSMSLVGEQSLLIDTDGRVSAGYNSGESNQGVNSVAIGRDAGSDNQSNQSVAIGLSAGKTSQGTNCIGVGTNAGRTNQGTQSVAIGESAGYSNQGSRSIAIGYEAGLSTQGSNAIAIGYNAGKNICNTGDIILNGSGAALNSVTGQAPSLYVKPVRSVTAVGQGVLSRDSGSSEVFSTSNVQMNTVVVTGQLRNVQSTSRPASRSSVNGSTITLTSDPYVYFNDGNTYTITTVTPGTPGAPKFGDTILLQVDGVNTVLNFGSSFAPLPFTHNVNTDGGAIYTFFYDDVHMVRIGTGKY